MVKWLIGYGWRMKNQLEIAGQFSEATGAYGAVVVLDDTFADHRVMQITSDKMVG